MYRRPKFLETLIKIRETIAAEADYDVDLFAEMIRARDRVNERSVENDTAKPKTRRRVSERRKK